LNRRVIQIMVACAVLSAILVAAVTVLLTFRAWFCRPLYHTLTQRLVDERDATTLDEPGMLPRYACYCDHL
jgi:hypothetical protein